MASSPPTPRTTPELVAGIVQVQSGVDVTPFIALANQLTTDVCTYPQPGQNPRYFLPYTDGFVGSKMELIERWLAAHFYTIYNNQLTNAKAGSVAVGFQYKIDLGLSSSMYGQSAIRVDTYGGLAAIDNTDKKKRKIRIEVIGPNRRFPYEDCWLDCDLTVEQ